MGNFHELIRKLLRFVILCTAALNKVSFCVIRHEEAIMAIVFILIAHFLLIIAFISKF
jgi:hypothetical protein